MTFLYATNYQKDALKTSFNQSINQEFLKWPK